MTYIPWGTEVDVFKPKTLDVVEQGAVTFFHSAGMNPKRKGSDLVLIAFSKVRGTAKLIIHSQRDLKAYFPELAGTIDALQHDGRLICHQETVSAPGLYHTGDVYVYPSRLDGIGLTIAEAQGCGLPAIVPDFPPMNEFVTNEAGRVVKVERVYARADGYYWPQCKADVVALAEAMQFYVEHYSQLGLLKRSTRLHAERCLDWEKNAEPLPHIFEHAKIRDAPSADLEARILAYERRRTSFEGRVYLCNPTIGQLLHRAHRAIRSIRQRVPSKGVA
jgi:glycosyltransferase involved in cell wall biosynthesis